jgi:hypothetical protein
MTPSVLVSSASTPYNADSTWLRPRDGAVHAFGIISGDLFEQISEGERELFPVACVLCQYALQVFGQSAVADRVLVAIQPYVVRPEYRMGTTAAPPGRQPSGHCWSAAVRDDGVLRTATWQAS